jgi:hypothetical protein
MSSYRLLFLSQDEETYILQVVQPLMWIWDSLGQDTTIENNGGAIKGR